MARARWIAAIAGTLLCCGSSSDPVRTRYLDLMDDTEAQCNGILEDLKERRGPEAVRARLLRVRQNLRIAQKLRYRRVDSENAEMDEYFDTFFLKLDQLEKLDWTAGEGERFVDKLEFNCSVCHGRFRE